MRPTKRQVREQLRKEHGMAAYAKLNLPRIDDALQKSSVIVDGLYSWRNLSFWKTLRWLNWAGCRLLVTKNALDTASCRRIRPLTTQEAATVIKTKIEIINKGGPIALADYTITNESTLQN